jgi:hypothetical protein
MADTGVRQMKTLRKFPHASVFDIVDGALGVKSQLKTPPETAGFFRGDAPFKDTSAGK